jgi:hypothetical protein
VIALEITMHTKLFSCSGDKLYFYFKQCFTSYSNKNILSSVFCFFVEFLFSTSYPISRIVKSLKITSLSNSQPGWSAVHQSFWGIDPLIGTNPLAFDFSGHPETIFIDPVTTTLNNSAAETAWLCRRFEWRTGGGVRREDKGTAPRNITLGGL